MKLQIIATTHFSKVLDNLLKKRQVFAEDYKEFLEDLSKNPHSGDVISGTGGVRKIRMKSASKGKRGGFRVCYFYFMAKERIYLFHIFGKNDQENITEDEKKMLRQFANYFKGVL